MHTALTKKGRALFGLPATCTLSYIRLRFSDTFGSRLKIVKHVGHREYGLNAGLIAHSKRPVPEVGTAAGTASVNAAAPVREFVTVPSTDDKLLVFTLLSFSMDSNKFPP